MRRKAWLWIGLVASLLWFIDSVAWGVNIMAHGGNAAILKMMACKQHTPDDTTGCEQRFQKDFTDEINYRWFLIGTRTCGPIAAGWLLAWGVVALRRRTVQRQPPPPFT